MEKETLSREQFKEMLTRYLKNSSNAQEKQFIDRWFEAFGGKKSTLNKSNFEETERKLWNSIQAKTSKLATNKSVPVSLINYWKVSGIAAAMLISFAGIRYMLIEHGPFNSQATLSGQGSPAKIISNTASVNQKLKLEDGTTITLYPESSVRFDVVTKEKKREVYLEGEAFFEVAHDTNRPFYVYTGNITTKVLGTSFTINARGEAISVEVKTGRVSVTKTIQNSASPLRTLTEEVVLTPNQKAVYQGGVMLRTLVEKPQRVSSVEQLSMTFDEAPISDILNALEEAYGLTIEFDPIALADCRLTTSLSDEDLYDRLTIICKAIKGSFSIEETKIVIHSNGCSN